MLKKIPPLFPYVLLFASVFIFTGCPPQKSPFRENGNASAVESEAENGFPLNLTDVLGRTVTLKSRPRRLISLSPSITEILFAIGAGENIVGVTEFCDYPPEAKEKTTVGGFAGITVNVERLASLKPDLVLLSGGMHQRIIELLDRLNINSFASEPNTFSDVYQVIEDLGRLTGNGEGAEQALRGMREKIDLAGARRGSRERPTVYWELNPDPLMTAGKDTWINDAISMAGGVNIFNDINGQYPQVALEQVILRQPEWILVAEMGAMGTSVDNFTNRAGWSRIPAVRRGNIGAVEADSLYRFGPRLADAALAIAVILFREPADE
jgi:iron complex transport system substrate-binding protein